MFYYAQHDALEKLSAGKAWKFAEIRPDLVVMSLSNAQLLIGRELTIDKVGFVPGGKNAMNLAQALGLFLSFYSDREHQPGEKKVVPFPGSASAFNAHYTEIGQESLGRAHIFASGLADAGNAEIYNIGDSPVTAGTSWSEKWAALCGYFGLEGVRPDEAATTLSVSRYMADHQAEFGEFEAKHGLKPGVVGSSSWEFLEVMLTLPPLIVTYDLSKATSSGFPARQDILQNYFEAFELMKRARIIPSK